jgi:hypothetical protein
MSIRLRIVTSELISELQEGFARDEAFQAYWKKVFLHCSKMHPVSAVITKTNLDRFSFAIRFDSTMKEELWACYTRDELLDLQVRFGPMSKRPKKIHDTANKTYYYVMPLDDTRGLAETCHYAYEFSRKKARPDRAYNSGLPLPKAP